LQSWASRFQFLGIPPKGERLRLTDYVLAYSPVFPISRDPPEGGTSVLRAIFENQFPFPISRDPPEGGTSGSRMFTKTCTEFPISRDPPEGGTIFA